MRIVEKAADLKPGDKKVCLAIGFFDGVHLGHQQIIRQTVSDARQHEGLSLVVTFDRHPNEVVAPGRVPPLIYSLPQKLRALEGTGADAALLLHFDRKLSELSGEEFIHKLAREVGGLRSVCVGANFVFGARRAGNVDLLKRLGGELRFAVHGISAVAVGGKPVSSTRIRERIKAGHLGAVSQMLGRPYSVAGTVVAGDGIGRQLGFPTANVAAEGRALPPNGVYAARAVIGSQASRAVLNIGYRPTLAPGGSPLRFEAHLLGFNGNLYGRELEVVILEKLREEMKFASPDQLREQIKRDIQEAERVFQS